MLLNEINQKMSVYRDCTLEEIIVVTIGTFFSLFVVCSLLTKMLFGYGVIGMIIAVVLLMPVTKQLLAKLQKMKFGKPQGYYIDLLFKKMSQNALFSWIPVPYLQREGKWSVRRDDKKVLL